MNGEGRWDPERLGKLTLPQLQCLMQKEPPDAEPEMTSFADFEARRAEALDQADREEREWRA